MFRQNLSLILIFIIFELNQVELIGKSRILYNTIYNTNTIQNSSNSSINNQNIIRNNGPNNMRYYNYIINSNMVRNSVNSSINNVNSMNNMRNNIIRKKDGYLRPFRLLRPLKLKNPDRIFSVNTNPFGISLIGNLINTNKVSGMNRGNVLSNHNQIPNNAIIGNIINTNIS
ncbi:unnamed protein product [Brachionus calyciflorus]|uniref:Uncharacterized protein n=1 Tax=Brachionus calyciflorus TaxID=104777 RepID=A0A813X1S2_9BILA|nr:unnamed protein product [Brachionus calyciflorus]